jgi:hypothetical protein
MDDAVDDPGTFSKLRTVSPTKVNIKSNAVSAYARLKVVHRLAEVILDLASGADNENENIWLLAALILQTIEKGE